MQLDPLLVLKRLATGYDIKCLRVAAPFAGLEDFDYGLRKACLLYTSPSPRDRG